MRRVQRGWRVAMLLGLWACACSSDASWSTGGSMGGTSGPPSGTSSGIAGGFTKGGGPTPVNTQMLCPAIGTGDIIIVVGGKAGSTGSGGTGGASGAGEGGDGSLVPCPREPPIDEQQQACEGPGVCPYPDGTTCRCEACADGWCWSCNVATLPLGCPRLPPKQGESCPWTGAVCNYDTCGPWGTTTRAGCCLGQWLVAVDSCDFSP